MPKKHTWTLTNFWSKVVQQYELKTATGMMIDLEAVDYDMTAILDIQPALHRKYKHKWQEIGEAFS